MESTEPEDPAESNEEPIEIVLLPSDMETKELKVAKRIRAFIVITFIVVVAWGISATAFAQETGDAAVQIFFAVTTVIFLSLFGYEAWWGIGYVHTARERLEEQLALEKQQEERQR